MSAYGIKVVWAGWNGDPVIGFSDRGYGRWKDDLKPGTRMLIYESTGTRPGWVGKGTKSIVGEVEVIGTFADGMAFRAPTEQHDQLLPVKVISGRSDGKPIPLDRIRQLIYDPKWPMQGETWKPISRSQYEALLKERG